MACYTSRGALAEQSSSFYADSSQVTVMNLRNNGWNVLQFDLYLEFDIPHHSSFVANYVVNILRLTVIQLSD